MPLPPVVPPKPVLGPWGLLCLRDLDALEGQIRTARVACRLDPPLLQKPAQADKAEKGASQKPVDKVETLAALEKPSSPRASRRFAFGWSHSHHPSQGSLKLAQGHHHDAQLCEPGLYRCRVRQAVDAVVEMATTLSLESLSSVHSGAFCLRPFHGMLEKLTLASGGDTPKQVRFRTTIVECEAWPQAQRGSEAAERHSQSSNGKRFQVTTPYGVIYDGIRPMDFDFDRWGRKVRVQAAVPCLWVRKTSACQIYHFFPNPEEAEARLLPTEFTASEVCQCQKCQCPWRASCKLAHDALWPSLYRRRMTDAAAERSFTGSTGFRHQGSVKEWMSSMCERDVKHQLHKCGRLDQVYFPSCEPAVPAGVFNTKHCRIQAVQPNPPRIDSSDCHMTAKQRLERSKAVIAIVV